MMDLQAMPDKIDQKETGLAGRFRRRSLLAAAGAGWLALFWPFRSRGGVDLSAAAESLAEASRKPGGRHFKARLPIPKVLRGDSINIKMRRAKVQILPGRRTKMWTYAGTFPGPTIRRPAGELTRVTFSHKLPKRAGELSVHLHGGHTRSIHDGQPGGLTQLQRTSLYCDISRNLSAGVSGNSVLIKPGRKRTYLYDLIEDGGPERAAFQWYHDHRLDRTGRNIWRGLAGMWIIDDAFDDALPLPSGKRDIPLLIADREFKSNNQLTDPFSDGPPPPFDGITGSFVLVNGAHRPHLNVSARRYRLRLLNASNFRAYNVFLSNGRPLTQIATDSGLMPVPVVRERVLLGPAERAEVIVDFTQSAGHKLELRSGRRGDGENAIGARPFVGTLMQFRVGPRKPDGTSVPSTLRPLPSWTSAVMPTPDRTWVVSIGGSTRPTWLINGRTFNPARSDAFPVLNSTETWAITNNTALAHVMHMHSTDWYMLTRNGALPPPWEDCLKESFFVNPGETIVVAARFTDFTGKYVIHCHMLDHEDHGLMTQFEVVSSARSQPESDEVARRRSGELPERSGPLTLGLPKPGEVAGQILEFQPMAPDGEQLTKLEVSVNGQARRTLSGVALRGPVRLDLGSSGPGRVTLVGHTPDGRQLGATRDYGEPAADS